jgi:penicillin V acylase-like amidase (Ntn superfamily)
MAIMQKRIEEIAKKNTAKEVQVQVEHFQNQLLIQSNDMDEIKRHIKQDENQLTDNVLKNETAVDHRKVEDHAGERADVKAFEDNFNQLRKELNHFVAQWM